MTVRRGSPAVVRQGSKAVERYTMLEVKDRFALMCAAFWEEQYKVGDDLEMIES